MHNHDHNHNHNQSSSRIAWAFFLNVSFTIIEFIGGWLTNSTAIMADAVHDLGDSLSIGLAWLLGKLSSKKSTPEFSYGYHRFSLLGALLNSVVHPLHQLIETVAGTTPLLFVGVPQNVLMLLVVAVVLQLLLQHSNVAYFTGPLRRVLAINAVHRFHHLNTAEEGDVNFGLFTTLTDRLLGTAYFDSERTIGTKDLGIASTPNYPADYWQQLMQPFRRDKT